MVQISESGLVVSDVLWNGLGCSNSGVIARLICDELTEEANLNIPFSLDNRVLEWSSSVSEGSTTSKFGTGLT